MMNVQAQSDVLRAYAFCQMSGTHFHLTAIPKEFTNIPKQFFDAIT
jgi:hypothetical protein